MYSYIHDYIHGQEDTHIDHKLGYKILVIIEQGQGNHRQSPKS